MKIIVTVFFMTMSSICAFCAHAEDTGKSPDTAQVEQKPEDREKNAKDRAQLKEMQEELDRLRYDSLSGEDNRQNIPAHR
ncbi:MAG: hypothetical protein PHI58_04850 [Candidatus Omnitrophica bacterium]|nr:hypothetical protein [Candidatus Omnitrophota bacterium]